MNKKKIVPLQSYISIDDDEWINEQAEKRKIPKAHIVREAIKNLRELYVMADNDEIAD